MMLASFRFILYLNPYHGLIFNASGRNEVTLHYREASG